MVILTHADYEDDDDNYNNTDDDGGGSGCTGGREYDDDDDYNDGNYVPLSYTVGVVKNTLLINFWNNRLTWVSPDQHVPQSNKVAMVYILNWKRQKKWGLG